MPADVLLRLPEWCIYIDLEFIGAPVVGVFVHLEHDSNDGRAELRILYDLGEWDRFLALPIHLRGSLNDGITAANAEAMNQGLQQLGSGPVGAFDFGRGAAPLLNLVLYLCAQEPEVVGTEPWPMRPAEKRTKKHGWRLFPPPRPQVWTVGEDLGERLRGAGTGEERPHGSPRAHIRRAHWHHYRVGPRDNWHYELRWLHPMIVNPGDDDGNSD